MIMYQRKDERGSGKWYELKFLGSYGGLMFEEFYYEIGDTVYSKDSEDFRIAYEKEKMWYLLNKTKRSNLEVLKDFASVAEEIEDRKNAARKLGMSYWTNQR